MTKFGISCKCPALLTLQENIRDKFLFRYLLRFYNIKLHFTSRHLHKCEVVVVTCTCNTAALETEFLNGAGSISVEGNSLLTGGRWSDHL